MTHDELLAKLDENNHIPKWDECSCGEKTDGFEHHLNAVSIKKDNALRAVVELHYQQNEGGYCDVCPDYEYPCRTIQAIEKELG